MHQMMVNILALLSLLLFSIQASASALPFSAEFEKRIDTLFFENQELSLDKVATFEYKINQRLQEVRSNMENYLLHVEGRPAYWARWEANLEYPVAYFHQIKNMLRKMRESQDKVDQKNIAWEVLLMESATQVIGSKNRAFFFEDWEVGEFMNFSLRKGQLEKTESANLVKTKNLFFDSPELKALKLRGVDLDKISLDQKKWFLDSERVQEQRIETQRFRLKKIESYTHKPRFFVEEEAKNARFDTKSQYTLRVGPGIHAEATSSQLLLQLGFHAYTSEVKENVSMSLGQMSFNEFKKQWAQIYSENKLVLEDYLSEVKEDESGQTHLIWRRALVQKTPELEFVGPWSPFENDLMSQREIRSLALYSIWTDHTRVAQFRGRDLYWNSQSQDEYQSENSYRFYLSELDHSFGSDKGERPGALSWDLVKKNKDSSVTFHYKGRGLDKFQMTWADARWMAEKIGRLSPRQIEFSVQAGGWPLAVQELLVQKLINRRNQLVEAFKLEDTVSTLEVDKKITSADSSVIQGELVQDYFPGYSQSFGSAFYDTMEPILKAIKEGVYAGGRSLISSFNGMDINPIEIGIDSNIIYRVIFGFNRSIEKNLEPTGDDDIYLVKDTFKIGLRLGAGLVLSGDVAYVKEYNLVYPVASKAQGQMKNNFLVNLLLPAQVHSEKLPERHVLVLENYLEGRGRLRLGNSFTGIGTFLSASQVNLSRTYISQNTQDKAYIFEDSSLFTELAYRINLELGAVGIPVFNTHIRQGNLKRKYYELDLKNKEHADALSSALKFGMNGKLRALGASHRIDDKFLEQHRYFNLFGIIRAQTRTRFDDITEYHMNDPHPGEYVLLRRYQLEQLKRSSWTLGLTGEDMESRVILTGKPSLENDIGSGLEDITDPSIQILMSIHDKTTATGELERYIEMINEMAQDPEFINFTPSLHARNDLWGETEVFVTFKLYKDAIEKLIAADEKLYWKTLAQLTNRSESYWARALTTNMRNRRHLDVTNRDSYLAAKVKSMARHFRNAAKERTALARMRSLHSALAQSVYGSDRAYRGTILAMIHKIVGEENLHMSAYIAVPEDQENHFPGKIPLTNELGKKQSVDDLFYQFIFENASEIYNAFKF